MELIFTTFQMFLIGYLIARSVVMSKKIDSLQENLEKALVHISEKMDILPSIFKEDIYRSSLTLREVLETAKPIKPNNWDSVQKAFQGPVRIEINERN